MRKKRTFTRNRSEGGLGEKRKSGRVSIKGGGNFREKREWKGIWGR